MESTVVDNVVCTVNNGIFKVHTWLRVQQYILLSSSRRVQAVQQKVESTAIDNVVYTGNNGIFPYPRVGEPAAP